MTKKFKWEHWSPLEFIILKGSIFRSIKNTSLCNFIYAQKTTIFTVNVFIEFTTIIKELMMLLYFVFMDIHKKKQHRYYFQNALWSVYFYFWAKPEKSHFIPSVYVL